MPCSNHAHRIASWCAICMLSSHCDFAKEAGVLYLSCVANRLHAARMSPACIRLMRFACPQRDDVHRGEPSWRRSCAVRETAAEPASAPPRRLRPAVSAAALAAAQ